MQWARGLVLAVCCASLLIACGGGGGTTTEAGQPPSTTLPTVPREVGPDAIVLRLSDFREGWKELPITAEAAQGAAAVATAVYECAEVKAPPAPSGSAAVGFQLSEFTRVTSSADLMATVEEAQQVYRAVTGERAGACARDIFAEGLRAAGVPVGSSSVEPLAIAPLGDEASAFRVVATVGTGQQLPIYVDALVIRKGRALLGLGLVNGGAPFVADVAADLAGKMAARA